MTLGKHEAHMLKLRYSNTSNFEISAKSRGEEDGSGACVMWGSRPPPTGPSVVAVRAAKISPPEDSCPRRILAAAAAGISPLPPPASRR